MSELSIRCTICRDADIIFNMAGQTAYGFDERSYTDLDINASAQLSLLETCRAVITLISFMHQLGKYGRPPILPVDDEIAPC